VKSLKVRVGHYYEAEYGFRAKFAAQKRKVIYATAHPIHRYLQLR